jgi:hypothetical protein
VDLGDNPDLGDERLRHTETVENLVAWAWGWLAPQSLARFNVAEIPVGDDCCASFLDHMFVLRFGPGLRPGTSTPPESVIEAITGAYALLEGVAFDWTLLGGMDLEAAGGRTSATTGSWIVTSAPLHRPMPQRLSQ